MFYQLIENSPKFTTNSIGVIAVTGDCTNFNKYMYLCLKKFVIPTHTHTNPGYLRLKTTKNLIPNKPRKEDKLYFIQKRFLFSIAASVALMEVRFYELENILLSNSIFNIEHFIQYKEHYTFRFQNPIISIPLINNIAGKRENKTRQLK